MYRIEVDNAVVSDFLVDREAIETATTSSSSSAEILPRREQLVVRQSDDGVDIGLFLDAQAIRSVSDWIQDGNVDTLNDLLLAIEGVSHFVMTAWCASLDRQVTALELEIQGEIDKYITCLFSLSADPLHLHKRLFHHFSYEEGLNDNEADRYRMANQVGGNYCAYLAKKYPASNSYPHLLQELRDFYRRPLPSKLSYVAGFH